MSFLQSAQFEWKKLNQASETVAAGVAADVDTYALAYGGTWAATTAAQNPANWPSSLATRLPIESNGIILRFLIKHTSAPNDKTFAGVLWGRQPSNGVAMDIARFTVVQGGTTVVEVDPTTAGALTGASTVWHYCDVATVGTANRPLDKYGSTNGIVEIAIDLLGVADLFFDFDMDGGGGTKGTDAMVLYYIM